MLMSSIIPAKGKTLLSGPMLSWAQPIALEIVATATPASGNVVHLVDNDQDGVLALRQFGQWEKIRGRKTKGPHIHSINYRNITCSMGLRNIIIETLASDKTPTVIVRDVSRMVSPMLPNDPWLQWMTELAHYVPCNILTVTHTGILGRDTLPARLFTACWSIADGHEDIGGRATERYGERRNLVNTKTGQTIKLHGHNFQNGLAFDLYSEPQQKAVAS